MRNASEGGSELSGIFESRVHFLREGTGDEGFERRVK